MTILLRPIITEKTLLLASQKNVFTFEVDAKAHKWQIGSAIKDLYKVDVEAVRTARKYRVKKATGRKRLAVLKGFTKKAMVTLKEGQTIGLFDMATQE